MGKALVSVSGLVANSGGNSSGYKRLHTKLPLSLFALVFVSKIIIQIALNAAGHSALKHSPCASMLLGTHCKPHI